MIDLDELLELETKATQGEHFFSFSMYNDSIISVNGHYADYLERKGVYLISSNEGYGETGLEENDARLFVAMRNSIRELCLELKAAREAFNIIEEELQSYNCDCSFSVIRAAIKKYDEATK